jgi:hypothetical protein
MDAALRRAILSGMPVVKVGRGNAEGVSPPAVDPESPTDEEIACVQAKVREYQAIFDSH